MSAESDASPVTVRLRLDISYDGSDFSGWAVQPGRRTVAGVIAEALTTLLRAEVPMVVAGRTDAGVHAVGQVAHIDVECDALHSLTPRHLVDTPPTEAALTGLRRRLAGLLPPDVRIPAVGVAPEGFDARFSALRRHYRYRIICSDWGVPPLRRHDVISWRRPLHAHRMDRAARRLIGLNDFAAYCKPRDGGTTIRDLQRLTVSGRPLGTAAVDEVAGAFDDAAVEVQIDVTADAFCHSMVRSLVGALIAVGEGRTDEDHPYELMRARKRTAEIAVAPAGGLTLVGVDYPAGTELALRAQQTRAVRGAAEDCGCGAE